jgi:DNA-binding transcriptional LysR family regulator
MLSLGRETLAPYAKADAQGQPMFSLPSRPGAKVPLLSYASGAYLGRLVEQITKLAGTPLNLDAIFETDMAEGLKAMALEGHGLAFLPASSVKKELKSRRLMRAAAPGEFELEMEVRIYRERPELSRQRKGVAQALWDFLRDKKA